LKADILFSRYYIAIENSVIFKNDSGDIDYPLTNSIITLLEFRVYMDGDFIIIGGSTSQNTYIMLEGEAIIFSLNEKFMAYIKSGGHYSNDLSPDDEDRFEYKRPLHMVSYGISVVGVLSKDHLYNLYTAYPQFQNYF